jgi:hypothetical protein
MEAIGAGEPVQQKSPVTKTKQQTKLQIGTAGVVHTSLSGVKSYD